jgi:type IV secretion system protein VirB10
VEGGVFSGKNGNNGGERRGERQSSSDEDPPESGEEARQTQRTQPEYSGTFLGEGTLWAGTLIPGVLVTGINTDLPGDVIARVTRNVYDSQTGRTLLIPQGSLLYAAYNAQVSYAQRRVQIVWSTLVRPDGFQVELGGANGVDRRGMAGLEAEHHENWFEYLKAAGLITMFSVANSKMSEQAGKYANDTTAAAIAQSNAAFVNETGGKIIGRALNIKPTLTVDSGEPVNIMLNRNLRLPPAAEVPVKQKYSLKN